MSDNIREKRCPICKAPRSVEFSPFCSRGCRDRDLLGWFGEDYKLAGQSSDDDEVQKSSDYGVDSNDS